MKQAASSEWGQSPQGKTKTPSSGPPTDNQNDSGVISAPQIGEGRQPVVMVATKQLQLRAFGTTVLQAAGFHVLAKTRGQSIVDDMENIKPDLILTDPALDDMDATRLCSLIRQLPSGRTVPILVISDQPDAPTIRRILSEDFTDFISVPINWKILTFRIHRWISMAEKFRALSDQDLDIEQVKDSALKASTELLQLRNYDSVTGLPNREMFLSTTGLVLSQIQRSSGYAAVLYLDIDDFKGVNDLIGRSLGDELLRIVAKRMQGCLRDGDVVTQGGDSALTSFARLNGDQFAILLSSVQNRDASAAVARRLLENLARPLTVRDRQFRLAARIGIADSSQDGTEDAASGEEEEALVQRAETAMRYCKQRKGKSYAFYESFMNELVLEKLELKAELRQAIDQEQLFLVYQLLVDSETATPQGVEGLVRWQHPKRGLVPPNNFLPVAEESDLIVDVDRWVLRSGCLQGKKWLDAGFPPLKISLNVSMRFLEEDDFAKQILAIVDETGLPPSALQLELSERGTLPDAGKIMSQFDLLAGRGIQLALDDFGTGQTSLSYLRTLPISCVKVDQSFVRRVPDDSASVAIVSAIVAMSHELGLKVVAEGVETDEHWRFLAQQSYDQLQGYLFSKPIPAPELNDILRSPAPQRHLGKIAEAATKKVPPPSENPYKAKLRIPEGVTIPAAESEANAGKTVPRMSSDTQQRPEPKPASRPTPDQLADDRLQLPDARPASDDDGHLQQLARKDFLTKLFNRFSFDERLEHAVAHADRFQHKVALLLIDLDDFKYVNDTHGHAVGDGLLIAIARRLKKLVRKVDTLARIGGDEFAVVLSEFHEVRAVAEFASRLLAVLDKPVKVEGHELRVTGSLGVSVYPSGTTQAKDLMRQADLALYKVKNHGGNSVRFFAREMDREVQRRLVLARDLKGAMQRNELFLEYQLQVALKTGTIVGVEALLRWDHPQKGVIRPASFIPIAESTGDIRGIGRWVIRTVCEQAQEWRQRFGRDLPVSVNLSPVQCRDSRFVATITEALQANELPPKLLDLELNEKLLEMAPQGFEDSLQQLSELGVSLTLDNFGSGSSALEHFQKFRFDRLKIHQSLVRTIGGRSVSASVLSGIVALARKMDVQIIAEGIEKSEEVEGLLAEGCEVGQGFLFSKPQAATAIAAILSRSARVPLEPEAAKEEPSTIQVSVDAGTVGPSAPQILEITHPPELPQPQLAEPEPAKQLDHTDSQRISLPRDIDSQGIFIGGLKGGVESLIAEPDPENASGFYRLEDDDGSEDPTFISQTPEAPPSVQGEVLPAIEEEALPSVEDGTLPSMNNGALPPIDDGTLPSMNEETLPPIDDGTLPSIDDGTLPSIRNRSADVALSSPALPPPARPDATGAFAISVAQPESTWKQHLTTALVAIVLAGAILLWSPWKEAGSPTHEGAIESGASATESAPQPSPTGPSTQTPSTAPPRPAVDPRQPLIDTVEAWALAWSDQRADAFLRFYAPAFDPPRNLSREAWEGERRDRILKPREIEVRLSAIEAQALDADRGRVTFMQSYRSDTYSDSVIKTLELIRIEGKWLIAQEQVEG